MPEPPHTYLGERVVFPVQELRAWLRERVERGESEIDRAVDETLSAFEE